MDYRSALGGLLQLVDLERMASHTRERIRYDLRRMVALLQRLGNPHQGIPTVHIAGTKGKGSTAAMCASVLSQQGYRTGLFSSPHLHTFRERIRLNGTPVSEEEFAALLEEVWPAMGWVRDNTELGEVTMFEALTAMALCHFSRRADIQVLEVGLGGRLDTTNVVTPRVCAITSLSLDHTAILGDTIEAIAGEKAGIIKAGVPVVTSPQVPEAMRVIETTCRERRCQLVKVGEALTWRKGTVTPQGQSVEVCGRLGNYHLRTPLLGDYQLENLSTAVGVLEVLQEQGYVINKPAISQGFRQLCWPCRMEVLKDAPLVVCDGAHNPYSVARLRDSLPGYFGYQRVVLIVGVSQDKNLEGIVKELAAMSSQVIATRSRHPRATPTGTLVEAFHAHHIEATQAENVASALSTALEQARADDLVLATGSLFVAAEAREVIKGIEPELYPELLGNPRHSAASPQVDPAITGQKVVYD